MTIAIGSKYPWGSFSQIFPAGMRMAEAVIMLSDTRFSKKVRGKHEKVTDRGTKLFIIGNDCCMVYAGASMIAEICVDELRRKLSEQQQPNSATSLSIAQQTFKEVYEREVASMSLVARDTPLYILVGACNNQGRAELYHFSYSNRFLPEMVTGMKALGWPETITEFNNLLNTLADKQLGNKLSFRHQQPEISPASWLPVVLFQAEEAAMAFAGTLNRIIVTGCDKTIGGMIQCAIITKKGISLPSISYSTKPASPSPEWRRVTARPDELMTVTDVSGIIESRTLAD